MLFIQYGRVVSQVMTVSGNTVVHLKQGSILSVRGGLDLKSGASIVHDNAGVSNLYISGRFNYLGTYTQNTFGILRFYSNLQDTISGNNLTIPRLWIMKTGSGNMLSLANGTNLIIEQALRLVSNHILNIDRSDLTLEQGVMIYPDSTSTYTTDPLTDPFSNNKHISTSGKVELSGTIKRKLTPVSGLNTDVGVRFPIGSVNDTTTPTARYYTPARYVFNADIETIFGSGSWLSVKCIASEHYATEVKEVALKKYWKTDFSNIIVKSGGYNIRFNYNQAEVQGFEELYFLNLFYRPVDETFYINPGLGYGVEPINNRFYVDEVNKKELATNLQLDGEWTAGQEEAISTFYYSRTNGDWNDPNTWSKQGYNGVPSPTYPKTENDKAFIGNGRTVTVTATTDEINRTMIESTGRLLFPNPNIQLLGDSLFLKAGGTLAISNPDGIHASGPDGHIQTLRIRSYSTNAIYEFIGDQNQETGPGIPDIVNSIIINKSASDKTVSLTKSILIRDSLVINEGKYHLFLNGNFTSNGETGDTTNRRITMRGGELVTQSFPTKYKNGVFSAGTITFDGTGSFRVPSSESPSPGEPAVTQYYNLKFTGSRNANTFVTLDPTGQIRIGGQLDISGLSFNLNPISERFTVTGSKVVFNGSGNQVIPTGYATAVGINYRLKFHDLIIDGSGIKSFADPNDDDPENNHALIRSLVNIKQGTLKSNNHWIKVLGNWKAESGSTFDAGTGLVTFEADGKVTNIESNGTSFNNVRIMGTLANGYVNYTDSLNIKGNLEINPNSIRSIGGAPLAIQGNFTNLGAFVANTGRVYFNGASGDQTLTHSGIGTYYRITVNKNAGMVRVAGDSLIKISNDLTLTKGNIGGRLVSNKPILVDGTITRPGGTPGHVDGRLRLPSVEGTHSRTFPIGLGNDYAPMILDINGPGGTPGYLDAFVQLDLDGPNITRATIEAQSPAGPELDSTKNIRKSWVLRADPTSVPKFQLATSRTYDIEFFFPASDVRNGANTSTFSIGHRDTTIGNRWENPFVAQRTATSTKFTGNDDLDNTTPHYFLVGEPKVFTYYSIASGLFNSASIWSTAGYESIEPATRAPLPIDNIRIGNGKVVTLNVSHTINSPRTFVVQTGAPDYQNGHLIFGDDTTRIWGSGTFRLDSGAAVTILEENGIVNTGSNTGAVRTTGARQYNGTANHNRGHFIYARNGNQNTGNGLPTSMQTLKVNLNSGTFTFTGTSPVIKQVWDSLHFANGTTNLSTVIMKLGGNFRIDSTATFTPGTNYLTGDVVMINDSTSAAGGFIFNGNKEQWIYKTGSDTTSEINFARIGLAKQGGKVRSRNNIKSNQFFFHDVNRANFDVQSYNKYLNCSATTSPGILRKGNNSSNSATDGACLPNPLWGWIDGRLIRNAATGVERVFIIGTEYGYAPVHIISTITNSGSDFIEAKVTEANHPNFKPSQINQNTNIQRYYEFTRPISPASNFTMNSGNSLRVGLIFNSNQPRGGINPVNYRIYRLGADTNWTRTTNIAPYNSGTYLSDSVQSSATVSGINPSNAIFSFNSQFSTAKSITLMIGEDPIANQRVFYSKNSGRWNDPNTWANESANILYENTETGYAISGNASTGTRYPSNSTNPIDYAVIGDGDSVYFDGANLDLQYVLVEKSANGVGKLVMPGENYMRADQFVLKNGGKLYIGSRYGLTNQTTATANPGNIRRLTDLSILNYDWNSFGINNFVYIGASTDNIQVTGAALPANVGSLTIDYNRSAIGRYVQITNNTNLNIIDSLVFINGRLQNRDGNRNIRVKGDIVNYSNDVGFHSGTNPSNRAIILDSTLNQQIRGTSDLTAFPDTLRINKVSGTVTANRNVTLNSYFDVRSDTYLNLADNRTLTFGANGNNNNILNIDSFRVNRMIKVSGGPNTGKLRKNFTDGTGVTRSFTFPVGEDSLGLRTPRYGEAKFELNTMTFTSANLEFSLLSNFPHPSLTGSPNILSKYWSVNTTGITSTSGTLNTRFRYNDPEIRGNILNYAPAVYRRATLPTSNDPGWSSTLFGATTLNIDTTNKYIIVNGAQSLPFYDWTAGEPSAFARGKVYWSRATGNWTNPNTWTNITLSGVHNVANEVALNYPGYYPGDTVFIGDTHIVTYNSTVANAIDSVGIGITTPSSSPELQFLTATASNKSLNIQNSLMIGSTGRLLKSNSAFNSIDTLRIRKDLSNSGGVGRGIDIHPNIARNIRLEFNGNDSTRILGEGLYTSLGNVRVIKADSVWNTVNKSASFSSAFSNAVTTIPSVNFDLDAGMYVHDVNANITLSTNGDGDVFLGDLVGLVVRQGNITFSDGLICGQNASVWLQNGNLTIGNQKSENFLYESVTIIDVAGISKLMVAGAMRRRFTTSNVDFRLKDNAQIEVMKVGAVTNSSERRAAFDFGEANSFFTMSGNCKITIFKPMELNLSDEKDPDYLVSASTFNVTGGTVQFGHPDSILTGEPFNLISSVPFWNLDISKTYGKDLIVGSPIVTVRNNLNIGTLGIFNQNGNNLNIGGDFTIAGQYKTGTLGTRRVSFFGDTTTTPATKRSQTLLISSLTSDPFYDLAISKADSGQVFLSNSISYTNSNLIVKNTLEFSVGNRALINTGDSRYVQVGTDNTDLASVQRFGRGHVNGFLRRWVNNGVQDKIFYVGTSLHTPATILTSSGTGTEGLISVKAFGVAHPDIASAGDLQTGTHIDRYWQILPAGASPFALGDRTFTLTTQFRKGSTPTGDVKPGSSFGIFEHFRRTDKYPDPGSWFTTEPFSRTDSSTTSNNNIAFGDFVIGEISGLRFFSATDGDWNEPSTWVMGSYTGSAAVRSPIVETDRVFIGNGKTVTIQNSSPRVRSVTVEVHNTLPGKLRILDERYLRGLSFSLNDYCFLATDDAFGFTSVSGPTPNIGAIRSTSIRSYGISTYEFIGEQGQAIGDGPVNPKTIIVNNSGNVTNGVSFSPFTYTVEDSIRVELGGLEIGDGLVNLKGNLLVFDETYVNPNSGTLNLNGTGDQYFVMNDSSGVNIYNMKLTKPSGNFFLSGTADSASLSILRNLTFDAANVAYINARTNNRKVILKYDTSTVTRSGLGHVDGKLLRQTLGNITSTFKYDVGFGSLYMPATLFIESPTGTSGLIAGYVNSPPSLNLARIHPTKRINYYWGLSPWTNFSIGTGKANTTLVMPASQLSNLTGGVPNDAFLFRKSIPAETSIWGQRTSGQLFWLQGIASVTILNSNDYWNGLGEFYISEKNNPIYYSRQTGVWNDNNTWTLSNTHIGPACDNGDYPTSPDIAFGDKAYVGLNHIVTLNVNDPVIDTLVVRHDAKLDMGTNTINCVTCAPAKGLFALQDNATIAFGGTNLPSTTTTLKNFSNYTMVPLTTTIEYTGAQTITSSPFHPFFIKYPGNLRFSGVDNKLVNVPVLVDGSVYVNENANLEVDANALQVIGNFYNSGNVFNQKVIEIGN